jgi:peptidoglycan/xylan/chitin deacetylase (PgdA/CDA1 family)
MIGRILQSKVKAVVNTLVALSGWADRLLQAPVAEPQWLVLAYHRIVDSCDQDPLSMVMCTRRENFAAHLAYLKQHFPVLSVDEGLERLNSAEPGLYFSVTFDDGYADNLLQAAPELQRLSLPATVFVATGGLPEKKALWWDRIIAAVHGSPLSILNTADLDLPGLAGEESLSTAARAGLAQRILDGLWQMPASAVPEKIELLEQRLQAPVNGLSAARMDDEQLRQLALTGIDIQVHSSSHHDMAAMPLEDAVADINACRAYLKQCLARDNLDGFAYPGGRSSDALRKALQHEGYRYAFSTDRGVNTRSTDVMQLKRMLLADSDLADFKRCLAMLVKAHRS